MDEIRAMQSPEKPKMYLGNGLTGFIQSLAKQKYPAGGGLAVTCSIAYFENGEFSGVERDVVSINLAHGQSLQSKDLAEGEFFANHNSRPKLVEALFSCGWLEATGQLGESGYVKDYPVCRLTDKAIVLDER